MEFFTVRVTLIDNESEATATMTHFWYGEDIDEASERARALYDSLVDESDRDVTYRLGEFTNVTKEIHNA